MASQEPAIDFKKTQVASDDPVVLTTTSVAQPYKYSNRVLLKTILQREDGGLGLVGERVVIGGWVKSSKEVKKEPETPQEPRADDGPRVPPGPVDVSCAEIIQTRIPLFRSIIKIFGIGGTGSCGHRPPPHHHNHPNREKLEPMPPRTTLPSIVYLVVSDGTCVASLQVVVESTIAPPSQLLPYGTCILAEGVLQQPPQQPGKLGKHVIELKVEKVLHIGIVDQDKYILSKKRIPLEILRESSHFRPRTTTVASVMRIRNALTFGTHTFFQNHGFLSVEVPIITTMDSQVFSQKFQVTTLFDKAGRMDEPRPSGTKDAGVTLDIVKAAIKEKSDLVEKLKRSESNREALLAALQDLQKTNQLAMQLEAKESTKSDVPLDTDKLNFSKDFFSQKTYLTASGLLHLESYACALGNVYSFGPRFQANRTASAKQMAEMWMVEVKMAFSQLEDAMNCAEDFFKFLCKWVLEKCSEDMKFVSKRIDKTVVDRLQSMIVSSYERITYMEAVNILQQVTERIPEIKIDTSRVLTTEHLSYLADEIYKKPVIVYNFPKEAKPFYVRLNDDGKTVAAFDMIVPKVGRVIIGCQNEERIDVLHTSIKELGLPEEKYEWYLDLRRHGTVMHSGFSLDFDLLVLITTGLVDVRDVVPFPRSYGKANY